MVAAAALNVLQLAVAVLVEARFGVGRLRWTVVLCLAVEGVLRIGLGWVVASAYAVGISREMRADANCSVRAIGVGSALVVIGLKLDALAAWTEQAIRALVAGSARAAGGDREERFAGGVLGVSAVAVEVDSALSIGAIIARSSESGARSSRITVQSSAARNFFARLSSRSSTADAVRVAGESRSAVVIVIAAVSGLREIDASLGSGVAGEGLSSSREALIEFGWIAGGTEVVGLAGARDTQKSVGAAACSLARKAA